MKFLILTLVVARYIIFNVILNIINTSYRYETETFRNTVIQVAFIFYKTGWLVDPFICVWFQDVLEIQKNFKTERASGKTRPMSLKKKSNQKNTRIDVKNQRYNLGKRKVKVDVGKLFKRMKQHFQLVSKM